MKTDNSNGKLKKYIYSGIGLASHSRELVHSLMTDLVKESRLSEAEGKKVVASAIENIKGHMPDVESKYHQAIMKVVKLANAEITMLQKRIEKLEQKAGSGMKPVAKKSQGKRIAKSVVKKVARKVPRKAAHKVSH